MQNYWKPMGQVLSGLVLALVLAAGATFVQWEKVTSAPERIPSAERIMFDGGGNVVEFIERTAKMRAAGAHVVFDGQCISACTMYTALDADKVCATPSASFVFHSAFSRDEEGTKHYAPEATAIAMHHYPTALRDLLKARGWTGEEHNELIFVEGDDVLKFMRRCTDADMALVKNTQPRINT